ncbi:MAG: hypothetical protein ACI9NY_001567, partial [Kiritimatiellia bacterium]
VCDEKHRDGEGRILMMSGSNTSVLAAHLYNQLTRLTTDEHNL